MATETDRILSGDHAASNRGKDQEMTETEMVSVTMDSGSKLTRLVAREDSIT
jgi:hypothetical protein